MREQVGNHGNHWVKVIEMWEIVGNTDYIRWSFSSTSLSVSGEMPRLPGGIFAFPSLTLRLATSRPTSSQAMPPWLNRVREHLGSGHTSLSLRAGAVRVRVG